MRVFFAKLISLDLVLQTCDQTFYHGQTDVFLVSFRTTDMEGLCSNYSGGESGYESGAMSVVVEKRLLTRVDSKKEETSERNQRGRVWSSSICIKIVHLG